MEVGAGLAAKRRRFARGMLEAYFWGVKDSLYIHIKSFQWSQYATTACEASRMSSAQFNEYLAKLHERTRRIALPIPRGTIDWAPKPGRFTLGRLVRHLAGIERWMYGE